MKRTIQSGFTILELLIALGLLGGLLAVAWSILGTVRDAELRAEGLSQRLRTRQAVRQAIEDDLQHLVTESSADNRSKLVFRGDAQGFTARVRLSLDPRDFIQQVASRSSNGSAELRLPNPEQSNRVEYRVVEFEKLLESGPDSSGLRRTLFAELPASANRDDRRSLPEKLLSGADLYRTASAIDDSGHGELDSEATTFPGLRRIRFRYSDGRQWRASWDSAIQQSLPRAVELCFDLERRSNALAPRSVQGIRPSTQPNFDPAAAAGRQSEATVSLNEAAVVGKETVSHQHCLVWLVEASGGSR